MLDDVLRERIESNGPHTFFGLMDSLNLYGYSPMDSLGAALYYFTESDIWKDVAYIKGSVVTQAGSNLGFGNLPDYDHYGNDTRVRYAPNITLEVGIINEENEHLRGLFSFYRKSRVEGKLDFNDGMIKEVEDNCKVKYSFTNFSEFILKYLSETGKKYYGYDIMGMSSTEPSSNYLQNR